MKAHILPILKDNYVFILENGSGGAVVVDPGDSKPVIDFLWKKGLTLLGILITHHHGDHVDGVPGLLQHEPVPVWIPEADQNRWAWGQNLARDGAELTLGGFHFSVLHLPGHTLDHVGYFEKKQGWLFSGDVIFGLGCGRLFEGTPAQMFASLAKIKALPPSTAVYCTHEYTETNLEFSKTLPEPPAALSAYAEHVKARRLAGQPTVPLRLQDELACSAFLLAPDVPHFTAVRELRNRF